MSQQLTKNSFLKEESQMKMWESVFLQSRVNDGYYDEEGLPDQPWPWPRATWFQERLCKVREEEPTNFLKSLKKIRNREAAELH
jgi:hypothetical protein